MAPIQPTSFAGAGAGSLDPRGLSFGGVEKIGPGLEIPTKVGKAPAGDSFGTVLDHFVSDVDAKIHTAGADQGKVLSGESTNLHQAMISMQEASVSFSLMVEVRNKLVESYQEMMRLQV